jgi:hypothetical protein
MIKMTAALGVVLLAAGCQGSGLGAIDAPFLDVSTPSLVAPQIEVAIGPSRSNECPKLGEDLQGTVNGVPMTVTSHGGEIPADFFGTTCEPIVLTGARPSPGTVTIRVWDATASLEAEFPALLDARTLTLVAPADGTIYVGDQVELAYTPTTDDFVPDADGAIYVATPWRREPAKRDGGTLTFVAHEVVFGKDGPGNLAISNVVSVPASRCVGAAVCSARPDVQFNAAHATFVDHERGDTTVCYQCGCDCGVGQSGWFAIEGPAGAPAPTRCSDISCTTICTAGVSKSSCLARTAADVRT